MWRINSPIKRHMKVTTSPFFGFVQSDPCLDAHTWRVYILLYCNMEVRQWHLRQRNLR